MKGKVWKYGDDVNTDVILPGRYLSNYDEQFLASHAMEDLDRGFAPNVMQGDVVIGGRNFGCGSSREQAATALKAAGVQAVIAKSFARIFYRNAINVGLAVIQAPELVDKLQKGDEIDLDLEKGMVKILSTGEVVSFRALPPFIMEILKDGGLIPHLRKKMTSAQS
ncbi:MAG: 3-isopropylmalate dehydratase small subunit [Candidatus Thermoplasmatota archaeon]